MRIICLTTVVAPLALSWISKYAYKILLFKHPFKMHSDVPWECGQIMFLTNVRISASMYTSQLFATKIYNFAIWLEHFEGPIIIVKGGKNKFWTSK